MVQHMPFFGTTHGYYYFRPYHVMHVFSQQELATRWGGDPRNPYDNTMFHRIYDQMGVEAKPKAPPVGAAPPGGHGIRRAGSNDHADAGAAVRCRRYRTMCRRRAT